MTTAQLHFEYPGASERISVILKLPGETCNINCYYCYEKRKPYPSAAQLRPEVLRRFLELCGQRPLRVELHGGEPLVVRRPRMASLLHELRNYDGDVSLAIQTNGTLLDDEWIDFFSVQWPTIDIGLSLDGDAAVNDVHRVDYHDRGTTALVESALRRLERHGLRVGVISTVTRASLGRSRALVDYYARFPAITYLKFAPCLDFNVTTKVFPKASRRALMQMNANGHGRPGWATSPGEYADFVIEAFDAWKAGAYRNFVIEPLASVLQTLAGGQPGFCHFSEAKCAHILTLYPDGRIGSCDELRMPEARLGHVADLESLEDVLNMRTNPGLDLRLRGLFDKCASCDYRATCRGGCLATRLQFQGTPYDDEYCTYRMRLIDYVAAEVKATVPIS